MMLKNLNQKNNNLFGFNFLLKSGNSKQDFQFIDELQRNFKHPSTRTIPLAL